MDIQPIRTEADYEAALNEVEKWIDSKPGTDAGDRVDVLVNRIEAYEAVHFPISAPDDRAEVLRYFMVSRGIRRSDLIPLLGSKERVSEVLNRKRGLSLEMIRRLHVGLGIPAESLIGSRAQRMPRSNKGSTGPDLRAAR
jgi:HTH-type transcriptional regulator/antitoxin HigA